MDIDTLQQTERLIWKKLKKLLKEMFPKEFENIIEKEKIRKLNFTKPVFYIKKYKGYTYHTIEFAIDIPDKKDSRIIITRQSKEGIKKVEFLYHLLKDYQNITQAIETLENIEDIKDKIKQFEKEIKDSRKKKKIK